MAGGYQASAAQKAADQIVIAELRARLNRDVNSLVPRLFPAAVRARKFWEMGDADGAKGQSFKINCDGNYIGMWQEFGGGGLNGRTSGDMLSLIVHRRFGGDFAAAMRDLKAENGMIAVSSGDQERWAREADEAAHKAQDKQLRDMIGKASRARHLWLGAVPIKATPAQAYLEGRGIDFAQLGGFPGALRYRPDVNCCPIRGRGAERTGYPAMVVAIYASHGPQAGQIVACHNTFLDISGWNHATKRGAVPVHKLVREETWDDDGVCQYLPARLQDAANPAPGKTKSHKATLGSYASHGGYIPLRKGISGQRLSAIPVGLVPRFSEGIEDGLSFGMDHPEDWIGAAVSLANMANLRMPAQAGGICFLADNNDNDDADGAYERAVAAQQSHFNDATKVFEYRPEARFSDFNNQLRGVGI